VTDANLLYRHDFAGADVPGEVDPWPDFQFPLAKGPDVFLNFHSGAQSGITAPVDPWINEPFIPTIDGSGHGQGPRGMSAFAYAWLLRSNFWPGRDDYQAGLSAKWRTVGGTTYPQGAGCVVRLVDNENYAVARLVGGVTPTLRLYTVVGGVATQRGSTYSGTDITSADIVGFVKWRVAVWDNADGTTSFVVYTGANSASSRGTSRITWTGSVPELRGNHGTGVELTGGVSLDDILVDNHECYDLTDASGVDVGDGTGWVVEIDGVRYATADLTTHAPRIFDVEVTQQLGASGCSATLHSSLDWVLQAGLTPGQQIRVYHHGACRFRGRIVSGEAAAQPAESQKWTAVDPLWSANDVQIAEDDNTATIYFNVADTTSDYYIEERTEKTRGEVLAWLFERYRADLLFYGAIPSDADAFVQAELDAMDDVVPGIVLSGSFQAAVLQLLNYGRKHQVFVDPTTGTWHFRDITDTTEEAIECTAEWVRLTVRPDARRVISAIEFVGTRPETTDTDLAMGVPGSDDNLAPLWTPGQAANADSSKTQRRVISGVVAGSGAEDFRGQTRSFILVSGSYGLTEDEVRGAICLGEFVVGNTATKVYLAPAAWPGGVGPAPGDPFTISLLDERAQWWLSSMGVGRAFRAFGIPSICGVVQPGLTQGGLDRAKACGVVRIGTPHPERAGETVYEQIGFDVHAPSAEAIGAGYCDPTIYLAKKPERAVGLINFTGAMAGGSPPADQCGNPAVATPEVQIAAKVKTLAAVPHVRVPTTGFQGPAFEKWGTVAARVKRIQVPDFVDQAGQAAGLQAAGENILAVTGEIPLLVSIEIDSPWKPHPDFPDGYTTSQWAGLTKRVVVTSAKRTTGLESAAGLTLPVYAVTWSLLRNRTTLEAGTAAGWLAIEAEALAAPFLKKAMDAKGVQSLATLAQIVACLNGGDAEKVGAQPNGPIPGCRVEVTDRVRNRTRSVDVDDEQKLTGIQHLNIRGGIDRAAAGMADTPFPGQPIEMPGYDGAAAQQWDPDQDGSIPRSLPRTWLAGPIAKPNGTRGKYGSPIITDPVEAGRPPRVLAVYPWGTLRKVEDATGDADGGEAVEWSANDAQGAPTGAWTPLTSLLEVAAAGLPLAHLTAGSFPWQLRERGDAVHARLGIVTDAVGRVVVPGTVTTAYPDGVPADHVTTLLASQVAAGLRPRWETLTDPGGLVLHGPVGPDGTDAGLDWRILPPGHGLVRVTAVTPGTGTNGGAWDVDTSGSGDAMTLLRGGGVVHKQIDARALGPAGGDDVTDFAPAAQTDSPRCYVGGSGRVLAAGAAVLTGAGGILSMPPGVVGDIAVTAHLKEVSGSETAGRAPSVLLSYAVQGSAWTATTETTAQEPELTDGSGTGTAIGVFLVPGGAVPPGLRKPFDLELSILRDGDGGDMTGDAILTGIGVDAAVADMAWLQRGVGAIGVAVGELASNRGIGRGVIGISGSVTSHVTSVFSGEIGVRIDLPQVPA